jgi:hypothetical protein
VEYLFIKWRAKHILTPNKIPQNTRGLKLPKQYITFLYIFFVPIVYQKMLCKFP